MWWTRSGTGSTAFTVGDRVIGTSFVGAFAEEAVVGADVLRRIPNGVDLSVAAAFGVAHRTAYHVLRSVAALQAGEELVVLGAGGGVGLAAVELGTVLGASVTAVASTTEKLEVAASHGAVHLVDHRAGDLRQALRERLPAGADVVVDPVGGALAEPALRALRRGGRFVTVGYASGTIPRIPLNLVLLKGVRILGFQFQDFVLHEGAAYRRNEDELMELLASGRGRPPHRRSVPARRGGHRLAVRRRRAGHREGRARRRQSPLSPDGGITMLYVSGNRIL